MLPKDKFRSSEQAVLMPVTERDLARVMAAQGARIVENSGRYWFASPPGFYHAVHWMAKMNRSEIHRPRLLCWGYQTSLADADRDMANSTVPLHILTDIADYDINTLTPRRRTKLRNCYKEIEFVEILSPDLLLEQGYEVLVSAHQRTGYGRPPTEQSFRRNVHGIYSQPRILVLGGLVNGIIKGFLISYAIDSIAYLRYFHLASDALGTNIGIGLVYEMIQVARRSKNITMLVNSPHTPDKASLSEHKIGMGFPIVHVPSFVWFAPMTEPVVKRLRPYAHYRLTGQMVGLNRRGAKCPEDDGLAMKATL